MPKYSKNLFSGEIKWGVTPGAHVAHIIDPSRDAVYTEISEQERKSDRYADNKPGREINKVSQAEVYNNKGDNKTAEAFLRLAEMANRFYQAEDCPPAYKDVLLTFKKYLTAGGRREQQAALKEYKKQATQYFRALTDENLRFEDGDRKVSMGKNKQNKRICRELDELTARVMELTQGTLEVPDSYKYDKKKIKEPNNTIIGKFGIWTKTDDELFPHIPSPNDIKQGYGIHDCYVLSALTQIAKETPEKIMDCMKENVDENGVKDGTVTVRFYNYNPESRKKEPVYVTVNKTVNRLAGKGDVYASSSLWVQVFEKALVKYRSEYQKMPDSFTSIDYGGTDEFMNVFDGEKDYVSASYAFGFGNRKTENLYKYTKDGALAVPDDGAYKDHETAMYDFLKRKINDSKEVITVGNSGSVKNNSEFALNHGIRVRHAYTVLGVFENEGKKYVQLRDPYALFRMKYDENNNPVNDSAALAGTFKAGLSNMGTFNVELKDFHRNFDSFIGMNNESWNEFWDMSEKWKDYSEPEKSAEDPGRKADADAPAPEEDWFDVEEDTLVSASGQPEVAVKQGAVYDKLREPGGYEEMAKVVTYLKNDLDSTAMFFSFKNTKRFESMRDKLDEVYAMVSKEKAGKAHSTRSINELGDAITELSGLAADYAEAKYESITNGIKNGSEPSLRAVHRMTAAVSLIGLGKGELQIAQPEDGFAESMMIIRDDIVNKVNTMKQAPLSEESGKQLELLENSVKVLNNYMDKHPDIKEQAERVQERRAVREDPAAAKNEKDLIKEAEEDGFVVF